ncbi:MAG: hypothetical protein RIE73_14910 [Coleofasciculus sp. C1-SOL-03]
MCRVWGIGCRVSGVGCRVSGIGCRVSGTIEPALISVDSPSSFIF